jgi:Cu(I)/Ag(I) efflux system membrane fusion protein
MACTVLAVAGASMARAETPSGQPLYYQDPDGKPFYAASPAKTADGRSYLPVFTDGQAAPVPAMAAASPAVMAAMAPKPPAADHRILYYRNPMGLADTSPTPKTDAMGMQYIPVYADDTGADDPPGSVRISPGRLQILGVRTEAAMMRPAATRTILAMGSLQFDQRRQATVTTKVSGWLEHLDAAAEGDPVQHGQVMAEIYSPDIVASEKEYLIASQMGGAIRAASLDRLRALDIPEAEITRLRQTGISTRDIAVLAPMDGVVITKSVQEGAMVQAGQALYQTADLSDVWLIAQVQEQDVGAVMPGEQVSASFIAFPGRTFKGTVDFIYPTLSADTRTIRVRIVLPNPDGALRIGMYASVQIDGAQGAGTFLTVPDSAVLDSGQSQIVLLARGGGRFEPRTVQVGVHGDGWVQVLSGIAPGDNVVVGANFLIDSESNVRAALQNFANALKTGEQGANK